MTIRELLKKKVEVSTEEVEYEGAKFIVQGTNDATIVTQLLLDADANKQKINHWKAVLQTKSKMDSNFVGMVMLVHSTLQPSEGEKPFDELEIVRLGLEHGTFFLQLVAAANNVLGLAAHLDSQEPIAEQAVGNSKGSVSLNATK